MLLLSPISHQLIQLVNFIFNDQYISRDDVYNLKLINYFLKNN